MGQRRKPPVKEEVRAAAQEKEQASLGQAEFGVSMGTKRAKAEGDFPEGSWVSSLKSQTQGLTKYPRKEGRGVRKGEGTMEK